MCPMACHVGFPYIDILRYGGAVPGNEPGTAKFCCPEVETLNVFLAEVVDPNDPTSLDDPASPDGPAN